MICPKCRNQHDGNSNRCPKCGAGLPRVLLGVQKSSLGVDENIAAAATYAFMFISGIFFLVLERKSSFVRFHALQSAVALLIIFVLNVALAFIPAYGIFLAILLWLTNLLFVVFLFLKALSGQWVKLPLIGGLAERLFGPAGGLD